ncbi:MAG: ABC transporter ATP-binding protein [Candidatus Paceibacterota bacterium]
MSVAIRIENLSKLYRLGEVGTGTISHDLNRWWANVRGKDDPYTLIGQENRRDQTAESDYAWALRDVNLEVQQGEVVGIIGANGAGKSTLLKLISRITSPTSGYIRAKGRVASLLEVGTGMHPEMTARENIYLNGAILGMRRHEITKKFDKIIDFAGCRMYVDTPVKRYSSGMRVRLGFAVAAFLEPEILIVDEVLAVGDAEFQRRAIGKMREVSQGGKRTILFVSHNMAAVESLCTRAVLLTEGSNAFEGAPGETVAEYLAFANGVPMTDAPARRLGRRTVAGDAEVSSFSLTDSNGKKLNAVKTGDPLNILLQIQCRRPVDRPRIGIAVSSYEGQRLFRLHTSDVGFEVQFNREVTTVRCTVEQCPLLPGTYRLSVGIADAHGLQHDNIENALALTVVAGPVFGTSRVPGGRGALFAVPSTWSVANTPA